MIKLQGGFRTGKFRRVRGDFITKRDVTNKVVIKDSNGKTQTFKADEVKSVTREDMESLSPALFHKTIKTWLRQNRPFSMDHDPGPHVWNDNFDGAHIEKTKEVPSYIDLDTLNGHNGPYAGGTISFYTADILKDDEADKNYGYWIEKKGNRVLNSGWINDQDFDENPDFLWRVDNKNKKKFVDGVNQRNPFVLPKLVEEIYKKSI